MKKQYVRHACACAVIFTLFLGTVLPPVSTYADELTTLEEPAAETAVESVQEPTTEEEAQQNTASEAESASNESHVEMIVEAENVTEEVEDSSANTEDNAESETASTTEVLIQDAEHIIETTTATSTSDFFPEIGESLSTTTKDSLATSTEDVTATSTVEHESPGSSTIASVSTTTSHVEPTILSGESVAMVNILNILNSSFLNSTGSIIFSNLLDSAGTVDFRNASLFSGMCGTIQCAGSEMVRWNLLNDATISNDIQVNAVTGENTISNAENAYIQTGDAYAGVNLVNLANSTFIDSNYLLIAFNAFKGVNGDIVFPSLDGFLNGSSSPHMSGNFSFLSAAEIKNDVSASSNTGDNAIEGGGQSALMTGAAKAYANVYNQVNSALPGNGVSILLRISGDWSGKLVGAPEGLSFLKGIDGSKYLLMQDSSLGYESSTVSHIDFAGTSTAFIENQVSARALSGANTIENATSSLISTGNAYAGANIVNIANQNVIGRNWLLAIINIFGDFDGDISFGRPDLWVGDTVTGPSAFDDGDTLSYKITVINNGDAGASGVVLTEKYDSAHLDIATSSLPYSVLEEGTIVWNIGSLPRGKAVEIRYDATVKDVGRGISIKNTSTATLRETDNNYDDNTDSATITNVPANFGSVYYPPSAFVVPETPSETFPVISFIREPVERVLAPEVTTTTQRIILKNDSDTVAQGVIMRDIMLAPNGDVVHEEKYILGSVQPREEIVIDYGIAFSENAPRGTYVLKTNVEGGNIAYRTIENGRIILLPYPNVSGQVLGTSTVSFVEDPVKVTRSIVPTSVSDQKEDVRVATSTVPSLSSPETPSSATGQMPRSTNMSWPQLFLILSLMVGGAGYKVYGPVLKKVVFSMII